MYNVNIYKHKCKMYIYQTRVVRMNNTFGEYKNVKNFL